VNSADVHPPKSIAVIAWNGRRLIGGYRHLQMGSHSTSANYTSNSISAITTQHRRPHE
jgi:hypothetical protein